MSLLGRVLVFFKSLILSCVLMLVIATRNRDYNALSDAEHDIHIRKITGSYGTAVTERSSIDVRILPKYYRWIKQGKDISVGPSCKTIYIDGKQLMRKEETERAIKMLEKETSG